MVAASHVTNLASGRYRISAEQFLAMVESGVLPTRPRLELIRGELYMAASQGPLHRGVVVRLHNLMADRFPRGAFHIADQCTIWAMPDSLPEPDVAVVRGPETDYYARLPRPEDTVLVVEVAVTAMAEAREKASLYAEAGFACYLLVDAVRKSCDVYTDPGPAGYRLIRRHTMGEPMTLPGATSPLDLAEVFPPGT